MRNEILSGHPEDGQTVTVWDIGDGRLILEYWCEAIGGLPEKWDSIILTRSEVEKLIKFIGEMKLEDRLNCAVSLMPPDMRDYYSAGGREYSEDEALSE